MSRLDGKDTLFTRVGTASEPSYPALNGGKCLDCGRTIFPLQHYGCESCGSQRIEPRLLSGVGELVASATVHLQSNPHIAAPYTVGSIVTEDGAVVRAILDVPIDAVLRHGTKMTARIVPQVRPDRGPDDIRFVPMIGE